MNVGICVYVEKLNAPRTNVATQYPAHERANVSCARANADSDGLWCLRKSLSVLALRAPSEPPPNFYGDERRKKLCTLYNRGDELDEINTTSGTLFEMHQLSVQLFFLFVPPQSCRRTHSRKVSQRNVLIWHLSSNLYSSQYHGLLLHLTEVMHQISKLQTSR